MLRIFFFLSGVTLLCACQWEIQANPTISADQTDKNPFFEHERDSLVLNNDDFKVFKHKITSLNHDIGTDENFGNKQNLIFSPLRKKYTPNSQRTLIMEKLTLPKSSLLRYKNRSLGFFKFDISQRQYEEWFPRLSVKSAALDFFNTLAAFPKHINAKDLDTLSSFFQNHQFRDAEALNFSPQLGHGSVVYNWLADFNPEMDFVFAPEADIPNDVFCHLEESENVMRVKDILLASRVGLEHIISRFHIEFVNTSHLETFDRTLQNFRSHCFLPLDDNVLSGLEEYHELITDFYEQLMTHSPKTLFLRAMPNDYSRQVKPDDPKNQMICSSHPNVIRVGYTSIKDAKLLKTGTLISLDKIPNTQRAGVDCTDIFINSGFTESSQDWPPTYADWGKHPLQKIDQFGLTLKNETMMSTSWATPLALSLINHLRMNFRSHMGQYPSFNLIKSQIYKKLFDPLEWNQFENFKKDSP